jgi:hypothetical protein
MLALGASEHKVQRAGLQQPLAPCVRAVRRYAAVAVSAFACKQGVESGCNWAILQLQLQLLTGADAHLLMRLRVATSLKYTNA